jgi:signal transduction histidine kinase
MLAFSAVALAFVASTAAAEYVELEIASAAQDITGNAAPSIQHLAALRGDLRRFTLLADDEVDRGLEHLEGPPSPEIEVARRGIDRAWTAYLALPAFPRERDLWPATQQAKADMEVAVAQLDREMDRGAFGVARNTLDTVVKPAVDRLDSAVLRLIDFDADAGAALARKIEGLSHHSILLAFAGDGVSVLLTVLAALLVRRVVRRYTSLIERRADELEQFAGRVAHDVLGPLGAATLALEAAERDLPAGSRSRRVIASGKSGLARARLIADGLLEFARAGARGQPGAQADVLEVVRAVVDEVEPDAKERGIAVQVEAVQPGSVACAPGILNSIVSNLVRNAVKHIGDGPRRRVTVRARPVGTRVRIEVEDNGRGLPPELGDSVFEPYVRGPGSKEPGIGLGLATVKKITEAHGGRVDVRSVPGLGCRFGVELPIAGEPPPPLVGPRGKRKDRAKDTAKEKGPKAGDRPLQA